MIEFLRPAELTHHTWFKGTFNLQFSYDFMFLTGCRIYHQSSSVVACASVFKLRLGFYSKASIYSGYENLTEYTKCVCLRPEISFMGIFFLYVLHVRWCIRPFVCVYLLDLDQQWWRHVRLMGCGEWAAAAEFPWSHSWCLIPGPCPIWDWKHFCLWGER